MSEHKPLMFMTRDQWIGEARDILYYLIKAIDNEDVQELEVRRLAGTFLLNCVNIKDDIN
jgi:hypothetical protein